MTQATEYMLAELGTDGTTRPLPHCGSFYTDRWYGPDDDALTGSAAAWRAVQRVIATNPGMYTVIKVRTFERPEGHGLVGGEAVPAPVGPAQRMINFVRLVHPIVWAYAAGVAMLVALGWVGGDLIWSYAATVVQWITQ